jgi:diadenosine tetraphosphate (Ap4A) HIT family hydrolase
MESCRVCESLSGEKRLSPGPTLYAGRYWVVEHAYPVKMTGWLMIVLKRHAEALSNLSDGEFEELAALQKLCTQALHEVFGCAKEYGICLAESQGLKHLQYHIVARAPDQPEAKVSQLTATNESEALPPAAIQAFCEQMLPFFGN